jgi:hypothetical protein
MFTGSGIDLAPFVPQLPEMACKEALGSPLAWIVHPQINGQAGQPALFPLLHSGYCLVALFSQAAQSFHGSSAVGSKMPDP